MGVRKGWRRMESKITLAVLLLVSLAILVAPAPTHQSNQFFNNPCIYGDAGCRFIDGDPFGIV